MKVNDAVNRTSPLNLRTFGQTAEISQKIDGASIPGFKKTKQGVLGKLPEARAAFPEESTLC